MYGGYLTPPISPTGSGTAGRVAQRYLRGYLRGEFGRGEERVNEAIIGTVFRARVVEETKLGEFAAVIPEVEGTAHICGFVNWIVDARDPLKDGFLVRGKEARVRIFRRAGERFELRDTYIASESTS